MPQSIFTGFSISSYYFQSFRINALSENVLKYLHPAENTILNIKN